jgi:hypothetical protein
VPEINFWSAEENFFILEIKPERMNAILIGLDPDKKLVPKKNWANTSWNELAGPFGLTRFTKNIVIAADSALAYTALVPVRIVREHKNSVLYATELENLLAQEVGKVFNRVRQEAGKELGLDDLDVVLAHSRVGDFRIDGHHVLNPIGLKANRIEAMLELMLTTRSLLEDIKSFLKNRQHYFFTEIGRSELTTLLKSEKSPVRLLRLSQPYSSLLTMADAPVGKTIDRARLRWDVSDLLGIIREQWGVSESVALELYRAFLKGDMAPSGSKLFGKLLSKITVSMWSELQKTKVRGTVFLDAPLPLPLEMPFKKGAVTLVEPSLEPIVSRSGFLFHPSDWPIEQEHLFRRLAPFFAYYHDRSDSTVNRWLRRHLNWLGSPM